MEPKRLDQITCKYLDFWLTGKKPKTFVWEARSKSSGVCLGKIMWYAQWRQYCFIPNIDPDYEIIFSLECLDDLKFFLAMANGNHADRKSGVNCAYESERLGLG